MTPLILAVAAVKDATFAEADERVAWPHYRHELGLMNLVQFLTLK